MNTCTPATYISQSVKSSSLGVPSPGTVGNSFRKNRCNSFQTQHCKKPQDIFTAGITLTQTFHFSMFQQLRCVWLLKTRTTLPGNQFSPHKPYLWTLDKHVHEQLFLQ
jgi:hypothetical protein